MVALSINPICHIDVKPGTFQRSKIRLTEERKALQMTMDELEIRISLAGSYCKKRHSSHFNSSIFG